MSAYVAFLGRKRAYWTDWFNPSGFRHCFPFWYDPDCERWIICDSGESRLTVLALTPSEFDAWLLVMQRARCQILHVDRRPSPHFFFRLGLWCVPFSAHAVGSASRAFRPIGLWRDLMREGAEPAFVRSPKDTASHDEDPKG